MLKVRVVHKQQQQQVGGGGGGEQQYDDDEGRRRDDICGFDPALTIISACVDVISMLPRRHTHTHTCPPKCLFIKSHPAI